MSRHLPFLLTLAFCVGILILHSFLSRQPEPPNIASRPTTKPNVKKLEVMPENKPDFAAILPTSARKRAFFEFISPYIEAGNRDILALRKRLEADDITIKELMQLRQQYRIKSHDLDSIRWQLLVKVDIVPPALAKAQAAIESAWGTSRFAVEANNYFGQWCMRQGCGLVPLDRHEDLEHEVQLFESPQQSVNSYLRNLNSHRAYLKLRQARAELRQQNQSISGCYLANNLASYSQKGEHYVNSLKKLIRSNRLERDPRNYCKPVPVPESPTTTTADSAPPEPSS